MRVPSIPYFIFRTDDSSEDNDVMLQRHRLDQLEKALTQLDRGYQRALLALADFDSELADELINASTEQRQYLPQLLQRIDQGARDVYRRSWEIQRVRNERARAAYAASRASEIAANGQVGSEAEPDRSLS